MVVVRDFEGVVTVEEFPDAYRAREFAEHMMGSMAQLEITMGPVVSKDKSCQLAEWERDRHFFN